MSIEKERSAYIAGFVDGYNIMQDKCRSVSQYAGEIEFKTLLKMARRNWKDVLLTSRSLAKEADRGE